MNERDVKLLKKREPMSISEIKIRLEHVQKHIYILEDLFNGSRVIQTPCVEYDDDYRAIKLEVEYILRSIKED